MENKNTLTPEEEMKNRKKLGSPVERLAEVGITLEDVADSTPTDSEEWRQEWRIAMANWHATETLTEEKLAILENSLKEGNTVKASFICGLLREEVAYRMEGRRLLWETTGMDPKELDGVRDDTKRQGQPCFYSIVKGGEK